jgi:RNA polymerase sigma-70 factor (ECF subfamily)
MIARTDVAALAPNDVDQLRPRLLGLGYRMLGDVDEAEDVVQEAFLRWHLTDQSSVRSPEAWLVTVVTRLSVDRLRRLETERVRYPGPWLPEPIATESNYAANEWQATDHRAELASELSIALLVLLERLGPEERAAFLLREVFATEYSEIARILDRSPDAVRQMVHRARSRVQSTRSRVATRVGEHQRLLERFREALVADDAEGVLALLAPDVLLASDGGGRVRAARNLLVGTRRVSLFMRGVVRKFGREYDYRIVSLNRDPALLAIDRGVPAWSLSAAVADGRIRAIHITRNPDKLRRVLEPTVRLV